MLNTMILFLSLMLLTSCSVYSSAGRKQFEENAPNSIQAFSLQSCRDLSAAETWFKEEFPKSSHELVEMHPDYEVWRDNIKNGEIKITVFSKTDASNPTSTTESCTYKFESKKTWLIYKKSFLSELSRSLINLD